MKVKWLVYECPSYKLQEGDLKDVGNIVLAIQK